MVRYSGTGVTAIIKEYIRVGGVIFNPAKILSVKIRHSFFYVWNPYIMEIKYSKQWTESWYLNLGNILVPFTDTQYTTDHKFKFGDIKSLYDVIGVLKQASIKVIDTIGRKN